MVLVIQPIGGSPAHFLPSSAAETSSRARRSPSLQIIPRGAYAAPRAKRGCFAERGGASRAPQAEESHSDAMNSSIGIAASVS
jgi:hypothetical protein